MRKPRIPTGPRRRVQLRAALGCAVALGTIPLAADASATPSGPTYKPVPAVPAEVPQVAERDTFGGAAEVTASGGNARAQSVCADGAQWLRLRFSELSLKGGDTVTLTGVAGDTRTYTAANWPGQAFHTQGFSGQCVQVQPKLSSPESQFTIDAFQAGRRPLGEADVIVAAVGDICGSACNQTAPVVSKMNPSALILAGDNAYDSGSASEYKNNYDPHYGKFKNITWPSPGNHEYATSGASGYFGYFGDRAGKAGEGWYSFDVGDWHFLAINSNNNLSAQATWVAKDLAANTKPCTASFWHHPRFSGSDHGDSTSVNGVFTALHKGKADLVIVGHDHNYQRFAKADPSGKKDEAGIRELLIGTGGRGFYKVNSKTAGPREVANDNTYGVGKLTLTATGYTSDFVPVSGRTFTDTFSGKCNKAPAGPGFNVQPGR